MATGCSWRRGAHGDGVLQGQRFAVTGPEGEAPDILAAGGEDLTVAGAERGPESAVRCRVCASGIVVELDARNLAAAPISFPPYRAGSACLAGGPAR